MTKAIIYTRVSSERQRDEGHGLDGQEKRCRDRADAKGYRVAEVFREEAVSGKLLERPEMKRMLDYLDSHPTEKYVVLIDDLSRLARDVAVHLRLRLELRTRGAILECLNLELDDTEENEFVELVMAGTNQLFRKQNRRQVIQKQKARIEMGCWTFCPPPGLRYRKDIVYGKLLEPDQPLAGIYKEAIEGYRDGLLLTLKEAQQFILRKYRIYGIDRKLSIRGTNDILSELLYTGWIEYKPWGISLREGKGRGFIDLATYQQVQGVLQGKRKPRLRADYNLDFPARGIIACGACGRPFTASWNTGRSKRYAHYWCKSEGCQFRYKSIDKERIEGDFAVLLKASRPDEGVLDLVADVLADVWGQKKGEVEAVKIQMDRQRSELDTLISNLTARIAKTGDEGVAAAYEKELKSLVTKREELPVDGVVGQYTQQEFGIASRRVMGTLKDPLGMWKSEEYENKRIVAEMYFDERPRYDYYSGFGTAQTALVIDLIQKSEGKKESLVEMEGVEPSYELGLKFSVTSLLFFV